MSRLNDQIDRMVRDWCSIKEIAITLRCNERQVSGRISRTGYRRYFLTDAERRMVDAARKGGAK